MCKDVQDWVRVVKEGREEGGVILRCDPWVVVFNGGMYTVWGGGGVLREKLHFQVLFLLSFVSDFVFFGVLFSCCMARLRFVPTKRNKTKKTRATKKGGARTRQSGAGVAVSVACRVFAF